MAIKYPMVFPLSGINNLMNFRKAEKQNCNSIIPIFKSREKEHSTITSLQLILVMLIDLGESEMPIIVITINKTKSKELLAFDTNNQKLMLYSGTIVKVGVKEYLLFNNTRYDEASV